MGSLPMAMGEGVQPLQDALLEKVGGVGVIVGTRRVNEHVAFARVAMQVRPWGVLEERRHLGGRNPIVGIRDVDAESHGVSPLAADFFRRHRAAHQYAVPDAARLLGEQLGGKGSQRKPDDGICGGVVKRGAASYVLDRVMADATGVGDSVIEPREHLARKHVGGVHRVPGRAEAIDKRAQPLGQALCVMEKQYLCHLSSVRLETSARDRWRGMSSWRGRRYSGRMEHTEKPTSSLALGWLLVAIQGVLFVAVAFWPSSWGPGAPAARDVGGVLFLLGGIGIVGSAVHLGRALTPIPQPNGAGIRARGVYRWIRHPMYTSVLVLCVGVAAARGALVVWVLVATLAVFFEAKTRLEESFLIEAYDGYASYASRTGKFVPGVGRRR